MSTAHLFLLKIQAPKLGRKKRLERRFAVVAGSAEEARSVFEAEYGAHQIGEDETVSVEGYPGRVVSLAARLV